jgi:hypothetical protein
VTQQKYVINPRTGNYAEASTVEVSAGAADGSKIPNTNSAGVLDPSLLNAVNVSAGAGSASKIPQLDATGRIDVSMMPPGVSADVGVIQATEALAAGSYVNVYNVSGAKRCRLADCSNGRQAHGYVITGVTSGANATVYFNSLNTQVSGRTPGAVQFLGTAGAGTETAPSTAGYIMQVLGDAVDTNTVNFQPDRPIVLA